MASFEKAIAEKGPETSLAYHNKAEILCGQGEYKVSSSFFSLISDCSTNSVWSF